ncbi:hypothetical protein [Companilactobacillus jidongensis]|uniref:hypothetical protein n=1 Tax=Companilactobacillus jidongensis TaxID=2486006 RepID=UPI000F79CBCC|nr:hypothetical protein [Companilactobacillus jidongensis]
MSKQRYVLIGELIFFFLLLMVTNVRVQASVMDGPNVGQYIYEQHEVLTQEQYSKINDINDQLQSGKKYQRLYVVVLDKNPDVSDDSSYMTRYTGAIQSDEYAAGILKSWEEKSAKQSGNDDQAIDDAYKDNMLILYYDQGKIGFVPSVNAGMYMTDYKLWKITFGQMGGIKSNAINRQADSLINISNKLVRPILYSVNVKDANSSQWRDVNGEFIAGIIIFAAIIFVLLLLFYLGLNPAGADYVPDSYDNGFFDGNNFSNYQNNDKN